MSNDTKLFMRINDRWDKILDPADHDRFAVNMTGKTANFITTENEYMSVFETEHPHALGGSISQLCIPAGHSLFAKAGEGYTDSIIVIDHERIVNEDTNDYKLLIEQLSVEVMKLTHKVSEGNVDFIHHEVNNTLMGRRFIASEIQTQHDITSININMLNQMRRLFSAEMLLYKLKDTTATLTNEVRNDGRYSSVNKDLIALAVKVDEILGTYRELMGKIDEIYDTSSYTGLYETYIVPMLEDLGNLSRDMDVLNNTLVTLGAKYTEDEINDAWDIILETIPVHMQPPMNEIRDMMVGISNIKYPPMATSQVPGLVYLEGSLITPNINGAIMYPTTRLMQILATKRPPTFTDVFNNWTRIGNNNGYYPKGVTPVGEAAAWGLADGRITCSLNSTYLTGFVSELNYGSYEHTVDLSSINGDDDWVILILAYLRVGDINKVLCVVTTPYGRRASVQFMYYEIQPGDLGEHTGTSHKILKSYSLTASSGLSNAGTTVASVPANQYGWGKYSPIRVRAVRDGYIFKVYTSEFRSTQLIKDYEMTIDATEYHQLDWINEALPYGYATHSQQDTTFDNVVFESLDHNQSIAFDTSTGNVYRYVDDTWVKTDEKVKDVTRTPRLVVSESGITYKVTESGIEQQ